MADKKEELVYTDSTAKRDLDARLNNEGPAPVAPHKDYVNPDKSTVLVNDYESDEYDGQFVGVSPEYANAASDIDAPLQAEEGVDEKAEQVFADSYGDSDGEPSEKVLEAKEEVAPHGVLGGDPAPVTQQNAGSTGSDSSDESTKERDEQAEA